MKWSYFSVFGLILVLGSTVCAANEDLRPAAEQVIRNLGEANTILAEPRDLCSESTKARTPARPVLFLTHFSSRYLNPDRDRSTINSAKNFVESFRQKGGRIAIMDTAFIDEEFNRRYSLLNIPSEFHYYSEVGRYNDKLDTSRVVVTGGFVGMCQTRTVVSLIRSYFTRRLSNWFQLPNQPLTVDLPMDLAIMPVDHEKPYISKTLHPTRLDYFERALVEEKNPGEYKRKYAEGEARGLLSTMEALEFQTPAEYTVEVSIDGESLAKVGSGSKRVLVHLWTSYTKIPTN